MIFAAGRGSRLAPLTDSTPKCLVKVGGKPMLFHVIERLRAVGVTELVINTNYLAEMVTEYLKANGNFGLTIDISYEETLLDTGGALKRAAPYLEGEKPFFVHNADIYTDISLLELKKYHEKIGAAATLVTLPVAKEPRCLVFSKTGELCGWRNRATGEERIVKESKELEQRAFAGIHMVSQEFLQRIQAVKEDIFSIITTYLEAVHYDEQIASYDAPPSSLWHDIGTPEQLSELKARVERH